VDINQRVDLAETNIKTMIQIADDVVDNILDRIVNPNDGLFWRIGQMQTALQTDIDAARESIR